MELKGKLDEQHKKIVLIQKDIINSSSQILNYLKKNNIALAKEELKALIELTNY